MGDKPESQKPDVNETTPETSRPNVRETTAEQTSPPAPEPQPDPAPPADAPTDEDEAVHPLAGAVQRNPFYDTRTPETDLLEGPASQWINAKMFAIAFVILAGGVALLWWKAMPWWVSAILWVVALIMGFIAFMDVRYTIYRITTERIEIERGWLRKRFDNLDLFRIKDIQLDMGIIDRILKIGTITVVSDDTTTPLIVMKGLKNPRPVWDRLKKETVRADRKRGVIHMES